MIRKSFKRFLKNSTLVQCVSVYALYLYLKFAYATSRWKFVWPDGISESDIDNKDGVLLAIWHNRLAFSMYIFKNYQNVYALASPHTDGRLITDIVKKMDYSVIEGSTNRNPTGALREIIRQLRGGNKVVITPDGPRGPVYKVNSTITKLGHKYNKAILPVSCAASKYFELKSWDRMIIPKPFSQITVTIGAPLQLSGNEKQDDEMLENKLNELSNRASEASA